MIRSFAVAIVVCVVVISGLALVVTAQAQQPTQEPAALLNEVRLLRRAIEALAGNGARVQIVFGRLQLQEQRTTAAVRRVADLRAALAAAATRVADAADRVKELEEMIAEGRGGADSSRGLQLELTQVKRETSRLELERSRLAAEEAEAAAALAQEQGRWSELNRQLEELERALTRAPQ